MQCRKTQGGRAAADWRICEHPAGSGRLDTAAERAAEEHLLWGSQRSCVHGQPGGVRAVLVGAEEQAGAAGAAAAAAAAADDWRGKGGVMS